MTAKYFHQDSDVKTGVLMNYIASRILKKRGNKVMPLEDKEETLTGKDFSCVLDYLFLRGTYLAIALTILGYFFIRVNINLNKHMWETKWVHS
jgi:hypothetical protein